MTEQLYTDAIIEEHVAKQVFAKTGHNPSKAEVEATISEVRDHYEDVLAEMRNYAVRFRRLFVEHGGDYSMCRTDGKVIEADEREHIAQAKKSLDDWLEIS